MSLTATVLTDTSILLGGADLTGYSNKIEASGECADLDMTTFGSGGWRQRTGGLFDSMANMEGFWQAGDPSYPDDLFWGLLGTSAALTLIPTGGAVGDYSVMTKVMHCTYTPGGAVGELIKWTATTKGNYPFAEGKVMHPKGTARTTSGNGTGVQLGAVSSSSRAVYLACNVLSVADAAATLVVKLQSSVDNTFASPTDRITLTGVQAIGGQISRLVGPVTDTWWRVVWTISGGSSPSYLFNASAAIDRK